MSEPPDTDLLFKALADPSRRRFLDLLHAHDGSTLGELCEHLDMTRQGVTQHLALLEAANLLATVRRGREKLHFLNPVPLQEIYERWIAKEEFMKQYWFGMHCESKWTAGSSWKMVRANGSIRTIPRSSLAAVCLLR